MARNATEQLHSHTAWRHCWSGTHSWPIFPCSAITHVFKIFNSTIYIAIPRQWMALPLKSALKYRLSYRSLPTPRFLHLLDWSHGVYQSDRLEEHLEGSRTVHQV